MEERLIPGPGIGRVAPRHPAPRWEEFWRRTSIRQKVRRLDWRVVLFALAIGVFVFAPQLVLFASSPLLPLRSQIALGTVRRGERIRREFVLANLSLRPVTVLSVTGGCGCVASVAGSPHLGSFAMGTIVASFVAKGPAGPLRRELQVETDDTHRPYLTLRLEGHLAPAASAAAGGDHGHAGSNMADSGLVLARGQ